MIDRNCRIDKPVGLDGWARMENSKNFEIFISSDILKRDHVDTRLCRNRFILSETWRYRQRNHLQIHEFHEPWAFDSLSIKNKKKTTNKNLFDVAVCGMCVFVTNSKSKIDRNVCIKCCRNRFVFITTFRQSRNR